MVSGLFCWPFSLSKKWYKVVLNGRQIGYFLGYFFDLQRAGIKPGIGYVDEPASGVGDGGKAAGGGAIRLSKGVWRATIRTQMVGGAHPTRLLHIIVYNNLAHF